MKNLMLLKQTQTHTRWSVGALVLALVAGLVLAVAAPANADPLRLAYGAPEPQWGGPTTHWPELGQQFDLAFGYWRVRLLNGHSLVSGPTITAVFTNGRIAGIGGISRYSAEYSASRSRLTVGQVRVARTAGPASQLTEEQEYFRALRSAVSYSIAARQLYIYDAHGRIVINFYQAVLRNPTTFDAGPFGDSRPPDRRPGRDGRDPGADRHRDSDTRGQG